MKRSLSEFLLASLAAVVLVSFAMAPIAEAAGGRAGGGGGARAGAGGGGGGGGRQGAQINNNRADVRSKDVRSTSGNNVNVDRNTVVVAGDRGGCCGGGWDHPVAAAAVVGTTVAVTAAAIGSMVATVPPGCVPVNYGGMVYQQCGGTWYMPQGSQFVVVNPPY